MMRKEDVKEEQKQKKKKKVGGGPTPEERPVKGPRSKGKITAYKIGD